MSSVSQPYTAHEMRAGFLITFSALGLLCLLLFSGKTQFFAAGRPVKVSFNFIGGLEKNSPVHYAGHKVGKIADIALNGKDGASTITVTATVAPEVVIKTDSEIYIDSMGFMGEKYLEIMPGSRDAAAIESNAIVKGTDPMPMMELVAKGTKLIQEFEATNASLKQIITDLTDLVGGNKEKLNHIIANVDATTENMKDMTHDLKYHPWKALRKGKEKSAEEIAKIEAAKKN